MSSAPKTIYIASPVEGSSIKQWFKSKLDAIEFGSVTEYRLVEDCRWTPTHLTMYETGCGQINHKSGEFCEDCGNRIELVEVGQ